MNFQRFARTTWRARQHCGDRLVRKPLQVSISDCFKSDEPMTVKTAKKRIDRGYARFVELSDGVICSAVCIEEHIVKLVARTEENLLRTIVIAKQLFLDELGSTNINEFREFLVNLTYGVKPYAREPNIIVHEGIGKFIGSWINDLI